MSLPIHITRAVYNQFILDLELLLIEWVMNNQVEYDAIGVVVHGLSPRIKVNMREHITMTIGNLLNNEHPIILKKIVETVMQALDASIISLLTIRPKSSFAPHEIKNYLYIQLRWLLDVDIHSPSILGDYIIIDDENTLEPEAEEPDQN